MDDDGYSISYRLLSVGTPVHASDGTYLGSVDRVLANEREDIFDGIVLHTEGGERFVDAPEVGRIAERAVTLTIDAAAAAKLEPYVPGPPTYDANVNAGRLKRFFGGGWRKR